MNKLLTWFVNKVMLRILFIQWLIILKMINKINIKKILKNKENVVKIFLMKDKELENKINKENRKKELENKDYN